ncbi:MAG: EAL domain-containing protein [Bacteroidota bacterium]|nr:EAL domain-containing protein [Bacteroidota bacterium]
MSVSVKDMRNLKDGLARIQAATDYPVQRSEDGWIIGHFFNCWLSSVFQPVFGLSEHEVVGHAAYIRSTSEGKSVLSPWKVFALTEGDALLVRFDRLCRAIHALNYFSNTSRGDLYVTVQPRLLESVKDDHGRAFGRILDIIGVETSRVVIEIPIEVNRDSKLLRHVISNYRSHGYRIAVNHSITTEDWIAELASLYPLFPHTVRLEASALQRRYGTDSLVEAVHHFGASVLVHDIETPQQKAAAIQAGADLLQGRALGAPGRAIETAVPAVMEEPYSVMAGGYPQKSPKGASD